MGVLPNTVKFKTKHTVFFRRVHGVVSLTMAMLDGFHLYKAVKKNGAVVYIPLAETIVLAGKNVAVDLSKPAAK